MACSTDAGSKTKLTYADAGVDIEAGERTVGLIEHMLRRTHGPRVLGRHGGFAGMFRLDYNEQLFRKNYRDPVLVACTDGVGTKVKLAAEMGIYNTVGIDCVAMNVNDLIVQGAEPLLFLDYLGLHAVNPEQTASIVEGVSRGCEIANCALLGGECAEMPEIYSSGDFDIAGFAVGVVELSRAIDPMRVEKGDIIIGLGSDGVHSNGYSLVRKIIKSHRLKLDKVYDDAIGQDDEPQTLGQTLLAPTRIYARPIVKLLGSYRVKRIISGMAHITGGGLAGNINRALPENLDAEIDCSRWRVPPIFNFLQQHDNIETEEMYRVFNMGIGYVLIVRPSFAESVVKKLQKMGEDAFIIGRTANGEGRVILK